MKKDTLSKHDLGRSADKKGIEEKGSSTKSAPAMTERPKSQEPQRAMPKREERVPEKVTVDRPHTSHTPAMPHSREPSRQPDVAHPHGERNAPREHTPRKPFVDSLDLPESYGVTNLTLIPRDPHWVHAYWEIAPSSIQEIKNRISGEFDKFKHTLRMYDITAVDFNGSNANNVFDIDVTPHVNSWYINLWCDNVTYCAELGLRSPRGDFLPFTRSNFVSTPRASASARSEQMWMEVRDGSRQPSAFVMGRTERGRSAEPGQSARHPSRGKDAVRLKKDASVEKVRRTGRRIVLTEDDIKAYYSRLSPLLKDVIAERLTRATHESGKREGPSAGRPHRTFHIYLRDGEILLDNVLVRDLPRGKFLKRLLAGSSAELVFQGASESVGGGASEKGKEQADRKRKFFFEIGTELIVYGRTEPDAEVWLGDRKIQLRNDGTFSMRFALPDGRIPLDFVAISNDKVETRRITTAVERFKTIYVP